jgi:peptidoglycan hydrolase-like protein with peptidoglycan-binding domain
MAASCFAALLFTSAVAQPDAVDASADSPAATAPAETDAPPADASAANEPSATVPAGSTATPVAADAANADPAALATESGGSADVVADSSAAAAGAVATDAVVLPPAEPAPPAKPRYNKDDVRWIQQRLQELGYYNGAIDGAYGRVTREAIKSYQVDQELEQDGRPTPELREFMWRNGG